MESPETTASETVPPTPIRPGQVWLIAMLAAVFAAMVAWGVEEASLRHYGPQLTAETAPRTYRPDLWQRRADEPGGAPRPGARGGGISQYGVNRATHAYKVEYTAKAIAVSGGAVGAMFGLAFGLVLGLTGGRSTRSWVRAVIAAIVGSALCGAAGWLATWVLVPLFFQAQSENPSNTMVLASLLLIRGVPRMIAGLAGGLTLGVALGGGPRMLHGAIGGMLGAMVGVLLVVVGDEVIALLASQQEIVNTPILRSPVRRVSAILAVTLPSAAGAAWAILNLKKRRDVPAQPTG